MSSLAVETFQPVIRPKLIVPDVWHPTKHGIEIIRDTLRKPDLRLVDRYFRAGWRDRVRLMSGSQANYLSTQLNNLVWGKTSYVGETTYFLGLWTAALDDTFNGATASEAAYTSYARLSLTNNTTIFAAGSGTTTRTNTWPSDAAHNFVTSTGSTATVTYAGLLNGNAGTSADKGIVWCSVTSTTINSGDTPQVAQNAFTYVQD